MAKPISSELVLRFNSALVLVVLSVTLAYAGPRTFAGLILVFAAAMSWEWGRVVRGRSSDSIFVLQALAIALAGVLTLNYYPASAVGALKVNGEIGMDDPVDEAAWSLEVAPMGGETRKLMLADVRALPRYEEIIEFKCIEGWSTVTQFAGARLSEFTAKFAPGSEKAAFVGMRTPDEEYYVGVDMPSALHPQTLLAYEMNGKPLTDRHGAPLRLVIPVKYGIKNLKRIARIWYTNEKPADYWAEQGYDYYAGL